MNKRGSIHKKKGKVVGGEREREGNMRDEETLHIFPLKYF